MATFLSPEWVDALDRAATDSDALATATKGIALTVQQVVTADDAPGDGTSAGPGEPSTRAPAGHAAWHVVVDHGAVRVRPGVIEHADVTFTQDRATAVKVGRGELSAQAAFMLGKLRVEGDVALLMAHHTAFAGLDDVFAAVRESTTY